MISVVAGYHHKCLRTIAQPVWSGRAIRQPRQLADRRIDLDGICQPMPADGHVL